jgi:hypothetical protein
MFVDSPARKVIELESRARGEHRVRERARLGAIEPAYVSGHEERRHLVIRDVASGVRARKRAPFTRLDAPAIAFALDEPMSQGGHAAPWVGVSFVARRNGEH